MLDLSQEISRRFTNTRFLQAMSNCAKVNRFRIGDPELAERCKFGIEAPCFRFIECELGNWNHWINLIDGVKAVHVERTSYSNRSDLPTSNSADEDLFQIVLTTHGVNKWLGEHHAKRTKVFAVDHLKDPTSCKNFWETYIREWVRCRVAEMIP